MANQPWKVEFSEGSAQEFHDRDLRSTTEATALIHRIRHPAAVLGSTQDDDLVNPSAAATVPGLEVCRRRSGGGLVILEPRTFVWIDLILPRSHQLWDDDVNRSFHWVGELWIEALREAGVPNARTHTGPLLRKDHGRALCFAGLGPGEVVAGPEDHKVVGLSQRRTREHARFQCLAVSSWSRALTEQILNPASLPQSLDLDELRIGLPPDVQPFAIDDLTTAVLSRLPGSSHKR